MRRLLNTKTSQLADIIAKSHYLQGLNKQLLKHFDPALAEHCTIANFDKGILVVEIDSAAWGTHFRYGTPELLATLRREEGLYNLRSIKSYIRPGAAARQKTKKSVKLSEQAGTTLRDSAQSLPESPLKEAMIRLASNDAKDS